MVNVNGTLFFTANDRVSGAELWKSNGTASGTVLVKDLAPGTTNGVPNSSAPFNLTAVNGTLYFSARNGLFKSDGTAAGTVLLKTFSGGLSSLVNVNGTLYFSAGRLLPDRSFGRATGRRLVPCWSKTLWVERLVRPRVS
jgi:ELWxxDGT repeat protein